MKIYGSFQRLKEHHQIIFAIIIGTAIIIFWRGAWVLADHFLGVDDIAITLISTITALVVLVVSGELMDLLG
ncbi:MAG: hypothetical protein ABID38_03425 [Candidatus Diapherotrites archaeon]